MKLINKEGCSLTLLNRFSICLQFEFNLKQLDLVMVGVQLRKGVAFTVLGMTFGIQWSINSKDKANGL